MSKCWICGKEMTKTIGGCEHCKDCGAGYNDLVFRPQNGTIIDTNKIVDNGTAIHLTCDNCGREIFGCNIVNGMKFCAKCYQEIFMEEKYVSCPYCDKMVVISQHITNFNKDIEKLL